MTGYATCVRWPSPPRRSDQQRTFAPADGPTMSAYKRLSRGRGYRFLVVVAGRVAAGQRFSPRVAAGADHEVRHGPGEDHQGGPVVEAQTDEVVGGVDAQVLDPSASNGVGGDVQGKGAPVTRPPPDTTATRTGTSAGMWRRRCSRVVGVRGRSTAPRAEWLGGRTAVSYTHLTLPTKRIV